MSKPTFPQLLGLLAVFVVVGLLVGSQALSSGLMEAYGTRWIITSLMGLAIASMLAVLWHREKYEPIKKEQPYREGDIIEGQWNSLYVDHIGFFLEKYVLHIGICIFGAGSLFHKAFYVLSSVECIKYCFDYSPMWNISGTARPLITSSELLPVLSPAEKEPDPREHIRADELSRLSMNAVGMLFFMIQIPFLHYCSQFRKLTVSHWAHHLLLLVIGADVSIWFYTFLREAEILEDVYPHGIVGPNGTESAVTRCLEHATVMDNYDHHTLEGVFFPLTMEFTLAALEVLIEVWLLHPEEVTDERRPLLGGSSRGCGNVNVDFRQPNTPRGSPGPSRLRPPPTQHVQGRPGSASAVAGSNLEDVQDMGFVSDDPSNFLIRSVDSFQYIEVPHNFTIPPQRIGQPLKRCQAIWVAFIGKFTLYIALICGILEAVIMKFYLLHEAIPEKDAEYVDDRHFDFNYKLPTLVFRILLSGLPGLLVVIHCYLIMKTFKEKREAGSTEKRQAGSTEKHQAGSTHLHGSDVILILAAIGVIFITCFELIICICQLVKKDFYMIYVVSFVEAFLYMPQILLTAMVIYLGQRRVVDLTHPLYCTLQRALTFLTMHSFCCWIVDSFLEVQFLNSRTELQDADAWKIFVHLFVPPCIYFRYVSVILLLKVKNLMREVEIKSRLKAL